MKEELDRIGYLGEAEANWNSGMQMGGHFELHIEQRPQLVSAKEKIGVVQSAQAYPLANDHYRRSRLSQ